MTTKTIKFAALLSLILSISVGAVNTPPQEADITTQAIYGSVEDPKNFDEKIKEGYVVLDFFAPWCHPCKVFSPVFKKIAKKYKTIRFIKINVDKNKKLANQYSIRAMPTLIVLKDGKEIKRDAGFMNETMFERWIKEYA